MQRPENVEAAQSHFCCMYRRLESELIMVNLECHVEEHILSSVGTLRTFEQEVIWGFPGGAVVENPLAKAGDTCSSPGPGRSHMPQSN